MSWNKMRYATVVVSFYLLSACSSFGYGRPKPCPCENIVLPPFPLTENCVALEHSLAFCCFQGVCADVSVVGKACRDVRQDAEIFKWKDAVQGLINP